MVLCIKLAFTILEYELTRIGFTSLFTDRDSVSFYVLDYKPVVGEEDYHLCLIKTL